MTRATKNTVMPTPTPPTSHQKRPPSKPHVRPLESEAALVSVRRSSVFMAARGGGRRGGSEIADADAAVRVDAEDFEESEDERRGSRDNRAADDGHLALVNVTATDGEAAIDHGRDAQHEAEHHNHGEGVADAGLELGGAEACAAARL